MSRLAHQSRRIAGVQQPVIPLVSRWVASTPGTISFGQGVVAYPPPDEAVDAAKRFGSDLLDHRYGLVEGLQPLIDALEDKLARENGIRVRPDSRVVVTAGSNMGFINATLAILEPGDEVILPVPYYFNHEMAVVMFGAKAVTVPTTAEHQLDVDAIRRAFTPRTRAVVTCSPNNPTGAVYPEADLRAVNALCRERGAFHIHDEAYENFTYGAARHFSPGSIDGAGAHTISLHSFSKGYGMASWRVGYMTIPERLWDAVNKVQDTNLVCPPAISQRAALAAVRIGAGYARPHLTGLNRVREIIGRTLLAADVPCSAPEPLGAFYYFVRIHANLDPVDLVERLIREHRVAVMPGVAFGATDGCFVRLSYGAIDERAIAEGVSRLAHGLRAIAGAVAR